MANHVTVILVSGEAGAGKSTTADIIRGYCELKKVPAIEVALADRLKLITQSLIRMFTGTVIPSRDFYDEDKKRAIRDDMPQFDGQPFCIRTVLQKIGTEIFRDLVWPDIWCDVVYRDYINSLSADGGILIISDCRFANELAYFSRLPNATCMSMRINRPDKNKLPTANANHRSEVGVSTLPVNYEIMNDGTLDDLRGRVLELIDPLIARQVQTNALTAVL